MRKAFLAVFLGLSIFAALGFQGGTNTIVVPTGIYNSAPPVINDGALGVFQLDSSGNLKINLAAGGGSGGTASSFGAAFPATGTAIGFKDSAGVNMAAGNLDASGYLKVNVAAGGSSSANIGATGAAVPASAGYDGINVAGNLRGWTGVNPSGTVFAAQTDLTSVGGTTLAFGQAAMASSIPVTIASNQSTLNTTVATALPTGANVIGAVTQSAGPWSNNVSQIGGSALAFGQAAMASSIPVALASNQSALTVTQTTAANMTTLATGAAATGAAASGNPVLVGTKDTAGNVQPLLTSTAGILALGNTTTGTDGSANSGGLKFVNATGATGVPEVRPYRYNGTTWDMERNNVDSTLLASAARTVTTNSADFVNYNGRMVMVWLNVTVASGTGGLQVQVQGKDPVSAAYYALNVAPTAVIATGTTMYVIGPGVTGGNATQATQCPLPRVWRVAVTVGDASSYTYSVGSSMIQ